MANPVSTSLVFPFSRSGHQGGKLELFNGGFGLNLSQNVLPITLIDEVPYGGLSLYATVGTIEDTGIPTTKYEQSNFSQVSGVDSIEVPNGATFEIKLAFNEFGAVVTPVVKSHVGTTVKFHEKFWGLVFISAYTRTGRLLAYTPKITSSGYWGSLAEYGTVAAYKDGVLAVCDVLPPSTNTGNDELEVYRIESKALLNGDGEWEMPNGWPDNPSYPNGATPPKPRVGVVTTRVHEVGTVNKNGLFWSRTYDVFPQKPYFGDGDYKPATTVVKGSGFSKLSPEMQVKALEVMESRGKGGYA